ncbi:hypothetical protein C9I57_10775 [Trinickia symbiotica]|uniref:Uncharacterized protein n=1 Tax=Trinickia symbiotica TaxID=863227 RepID=A0A2T3XV42_9BURK|nr:hypothetical protein [Trinickia symbiotica]PTB20365.1 hypothetical protein C9I57_10775 [Trinickia symbiotica]
MAKMLWGGEAANPNAESARKGASEAQKRRAIVPRRAAIDSRARQENGARCCGATSIVAARSRGVRHHIGFNQGICQYRIHFRFSFFVYR